MEKQRKVVALSSVKTKIRGIVKGIKKIIWIRKLMNEIGFPQEKACNLYYDNFSIIRISE